MYHYREKQNVDAMVGFITSRLGEESAAPHHDSNCIVIYNVLLLHRIY